MSCRHLADGRPRAATTLDIVELRVGEQITELLLAPALAVVGKHLEQVTIVLPDKDAGVLAQEGGGQQCRLPVLGTGADTIPYEVVDAEPIEVGEHLGRRCLWGERGDDLEGESYQPRF